MSGPSSEVGASLIELVISIAVIAIAVSGTLGVVGTATRQSADPMIEHQSAVVAEGYLEEILLKPFFDPDLGAGGGACPASEASRDLYDNVCDYAGLDETGPRLPDGTPVAGMGGYRVRVTVDTAATLFDLVGSADVLRVDVRVSNAPLVDLTLSGYRARY